MAQSDICIKEIQVTFSDEKFRIPLKLSTGNISDVTYVFVEVTVENRLLQVAKGVGGVLLSDLWAFPTPLLTHETKDRMMRRIVRKLEKLLSNMNGYYDPFQLAHLAETELPQLLQDMQVDGRDRINIPQLVGLVCWSPFDAAIHDGWGKACDRNSYDMYSGDYLNHDLAHYLGKGWENRYPSEFLVPARDRLWVQHVVGASDPLTSAENDKTEVPDDGLPFALSEWIEREGVRWFKLKVKGTDVSWNLERIIDVYKVAEEFSNKRGMKQPILYEIDPNEACPNPEPMIELLRRMKEEAPSAYQALVYIEQPTPRQLNDYQYTLHGISNYKPVLVDESLEDLENLQLVEKLGWSGVALKTCKGQSHSLLAYCWAKRNGLYITLQDLTNPGFSLVHSANFCSHLSLSNDAFEYNSRQYAPNSCPAERRNYSNVFHVQDGKIDLGQITNKGLY